MAVTTSPSRIGASAASARRRESPSGIGSSEPGDRCRGSARLGADDASKDLELSLIPYSSKFDPSFQTQWFLASQIGLWNWQRWNSPEFDKLHEEGLSIMDNARRTEIYIKMQQLLDDSASCVWITHGRNFFVHADWLEPAVLPNGKNWQFEFFDKA